MIYFLAATVAVLHAQDSRTLAQRRSAGECLQGYDGQVWDANDRISNFGQRLSADGAIVTRQEAINQAVLISVRYIRNYKVLEDSMAQDQYILTQCGTTRPTDAQLIADGAALTGPKENYTRKFFTIPLQSAIAASTPQLGFVDILGVQDRITHHSQYASGPCFQRAYGCGSRLEPAWGGNATLRAQQMNGADAFFMDCSSTFPVNCANVNAQGNGVHVATSQDGGNVRGAEYVKFMAAFFNKEREANDAFARIERNWAAAAGARPAGTASPKVAWISKGTWGGNYFELGAGITYKAEIIQAAGATNVDGNAVNAALVAAGGYPLTVQSAQWGRRWRMMVDQYGSWTNASNWFFTALATQNIDWVVEENYAPNPHNYGMNDFLTAYGNGTVLRSQPFVTNNRVIRNDGTVNQGLGGPIGSDWFESRVAHPDWAVQGLARVLYNDNSMMNRYFRNVASGERPWVSHSSQCTLDIPACRSNVLPTVIRTTLDPERDTQLQGSGVASAAFYYAMLVAIAALLN